MSIVPMPRVCRNYDRNVGAGSGATNNSNSVYFSNDVRQLPRATVARGQQLGGTRLRCVGAALQRSHWENADKERSTELILLASATECNRMRFHLSKYTQGRGNTFWPHSVLLYLFVQPLRCWELAS
jgi:hypothetical protein